MRMLTFESVDHTHLYANNLKYTDTSMSVTCSILQIRHVWLSLGEGYFVFLNKA